MDRMPPVLASPLAASITQSEEAPELGSTEIDASAIIPADGQSPTETGRDAL